MGKLLHTKRRATLTVESNNTSYGTVSGGDIRQPRPYTATITATPLTGYSFVSWNDGNTSSNRTINVIDNINYVAQFTQYNIIFDVDPDDTGKLWYNVYDSNGTRQIINNTTTITSLSKNDLPSGYTIICDSNDDPGYEIDCWEISGCSFYDNTGPYTITCNLNNFTTNSDSTIKLKFRETSLSMPEIPTNTYTEYLYSGVPVEGVFNIMSIESNSSPIYLAPANLELSRGGNIIETMQSVMNNCLENSGPTGTQMGLVINEYNQGFITVGGETSNKAYPVKISDGTNGNSFTINIAFKLQSPYTMTFQYNDNGKLTTLKSPDGIHSNYALISSNNYSTLNSYYTSSEVYDGNSYSNELNSGYWMLAINQTEGGDNYIMFKYHEVTNSKICYIFSDYEVPIELNDINYITLTCLDSGDGYGEYSLYINGSQISLTSAINDGKTILGHPLNTSEYKDVISLPLNDFSEIKNYSTINLGVNERGGGYLSSGLVLYKYSILPQHSTNGQAQVMYNSFLNGKSTHIMKEEK